MKLYNSGFFGRGAFPEFLVKFITRAIMVVAERRTVRKPHFEFWNMGFVLSHSRIYNDVRQSVLSYFG
jgi:hypothetical protein